MKKIRMFLLLLGLVFCFDLIAQRNTGIVNTAFEDPHVYLGLGFSGPAGGVIALTIITPSGWGGSLSSNLLSPKAKNVPADYTPGSYIIGFSSNHTLRDDIKTLSLRVLKEFPTSEPQVRFGLEAGPSIVTTTILDHFVSNPNPCSFLGCPSNYTFDRVGKQSLGLSLKAKMEFPIFRFFGLEVGLVSNLNNDRSYIGGDFLITIGYIRDRK